VEVTGSKLLLLTTMDERDELETDEGERIPASDVMWLEAPESKYHSYWGGCWSDMV